ncbi:MAG TPA: leucyl aminopeptidase family protein [Phycisphaerales bacterium]|nr:leucyl aminopeptidase family protein [Phycisphaerales bacterium]
MFDDITIARKGAVQVLVLAHFKGEALDKKSAALDASGSALIASKRTEATGDAGVVVEAFPGKGPYERVFVVGLGDKSKIEAGTFRAVAAGIGRKMAAVKASSLRVDMTAPLALTKVDAFAAGSAFGEGVGLLGWVCDVFRGSATSDPKRTKLAMQFADAEFETGVDRGLGLAESTNFARTLSQSPPNVATPDFMAEQATKLARKTGMKIKVFRDDELVREKFEGLINVGKASENKPCMIRLEYAPKGPAKGKPIVLIGKTMTYDTGGLSLKINNGMVGMKRDKDGGCAVLGAMHAIATVIKPNKRVVAYLTAAENSLSDEAYRPDDVLTYRNGVTVEVTNTDAEGRLVLADALCYTCEKDNPACIIDLATLTGGVVVALGSTFAGMFCEDDKLRAQVEAAATVSGERVWRLPMHAEYRDMMKSPVADIINSNPNRKAHPIQGAAFLSYFVKENIPWCHLDIAGVHAVEKNAGMFIDGPTGWGVRLLAEMLDA